MLSIKQALKKISEKYQIKDMDSLPDIKLLLQHLIEFQMTFGGDFPVDNEKVVRGTIKYGTSDVSMWK